MIKEELTASLLTLPIGQGMVGGKRQIIVVTKGAVYKHPTLFQYLRIYSTSASDEYRHRDEETGIYNPSNNKDLAKVEIIKKALAKSE